MFKKDGLNFSPSFNSVRKAHVCSLNPNVVKHWRDPWSPGHVRFFFDGLEMCKQALQKVWEFNPQPYRQRDTLCIQWEFCPSKQLGILHLYTCLDVDLSPVNTCVELYTLICFQSWERRVPRVTGDVATPGAPCRLVLRTPVAQPMCVLLQERSDRYLWGYSSLRHSVWCMEILLSSEGCVRTDTHFQNACARR